MKGNRKFIIIESIVFFALSAGLFLFGVWFGLQRRWFVMGVAFFNAAWSSIFGVFSVLVLSIDSCFKRLEGLVSKQSDSVPPRT